MAIFLDYPLPDELLMSVVAAYVKHDNVRGVDAFCDRLFGSRGGKPVAIVRNLEQIARETRQCWGMTPDEIRDRLTLFPYFAALWPKQKVDDVASFCLREPVPGNASMEWRISYLDTVGYGLGFRHCTVCWSKDDANGTRRYWRRAHQLPGVTTCHLHGCVLSSIGTGPPKMFVKDRPIAGRLLGRSGAPYQHVLQHEVSLLSARVLEQGVSAVRFMDPEARLDCFHVLGYCAPNRSLVDEDRVIHDVIDSFGSQFLEDIKFLPRGSNSWVHSALCAQRRKRASTLVDVLTEVFLSKSVHRLSESPGPVCPSAACLGDRNHSLMIRDAAGERFHCFCSCGYSFYFVESKDRSKRQRESTHAGPDFVRAAGML